MRIEEQLVLSWAREITARAARETVAALKEMRETLSGDDSPLRNVWQEIRAQVNGEESGFWEFYEQTIEACALKILEKYSQAEKIAVWLSAEESWDWLEGHFGDDLELQAVPLEETVAAIQIRKRVVSLASD